MSGEKYVFFVDYKFVFDKNVAVLKSLIFTA